MPNSEILAAKGRLADLRNRLDALKIRAESLIISIRSRVTYYEDSPADINTEIALSDMTELHQVVLDYKEVERKISQLESDLNV